MSLILTDIWIYPLKSGQGIRLPESELSPMGLQYDRRWMLVDLEGRFLSQRILPNMARLHVSLSASEIEFEFGGLLLNLPLPPYDLPEIEVNVWRSFVPAQVFSDQVNQWFSQVLEFPCQLTYMPESTWRETNPEKAPGKQVSFADGYPYLLTHQASLDDLNQRLLEPIPMDRFRPNLVITGGEAFDEEHWLTLRIGEHLFANVKPCERCVITTIDQRSAQQFKEPLRTLARYYQRDGKVIFGQNLVSDSLIGRVKQGDSVVILDAMR